MSGWIKVYRDIDDHWISKDLKKLGWWVYLLYKASYEDNQIAVGNRVIDVKRGQLVVSLQSLADRFDITKPTLIKFLSAMERQRMITRCVDQKITIITICNYDSYQGAREQQITDSSTDSYTDSLPMSLLKGYPTKEDKEDKEINNNNSNAHTREDLPTWEEVRERGFKEAFKQSGQIMALARNCKLNAQEICSYLERYMNERQIIDLGHQDSRHFAKGFKKYVEDEMKKPKPNETPKPRVIEGAAIYNLYK